MLHNFLIAVPLTVLPLLLGGARPWIWPLPAAFLFFGAALSVRAADRQPPPLRAVWGWSAAVLLLAYPLLQTVPLPTTPPTLLSPRRLLWLDAAGQAVGRPATFGSISYTPLATFCEGFLWWLFLLLFALLLGRRLRAPGRLDWLYRLLFLVAAAEAGYGLLQVLIPSVGVLWVEPGQGVARGTFINRNHYACFLGMLWPLLLTYVWAADGGRPPAGADRELSYPERERLSRLRQKQVFHGFVIGLMLLALFFSQSRGGIIGSLAALTVLVAVSRRMRTRRMLVLVLGVWAVMLSYGGIIGFEAILQRFDQLELGAAGRVQLWRTALAILADHPWTGIGVGAFGDLFRVYQDFLDDTMTSSHAHNDYLQLLVELGAPVGALLLTAVWAYWWRTACRLARARRREGRETAAEAAAELRRLPAVGALAGVAAFLCHAWVEFNWQVPANALYFVLLLVLMRVDAAGEGTTAMLPLTVASAPRRQGDSVERSAGGVI